MGRWSNLTRNIYLWRGRQGEEISRLLNNSDLRSKSSTMLPRACRSHQLSEGVRVVNGRAVWRFQINDLVHCSVYSSPVENSQCSFSANITLVPEVMEVLCCRRGFAAVPGTDEWILPCRSSILNIRQTHRSSAFFCTRSQRKSTFSICSV